MEEAGSRVHAQWKRDRLRAMRGGGDVLRPLPSVKGKGRPKPWIPKSRAFQHSACFERAWTPGSLILGIIKVFKTQANQTSEVYCISICPIQIIKHAK